MEHSSDLLKLDGISHTFYNAHDYQTAQKPVLMTQVHSADVLVIDSYINLEPTVDALVTKTAGVNLAVKTADCAPVLLADAKNKVIGAVHAGWKGAFQGVIENTILTMLEQGAEKDHIHAAVGPCLHRASFEVTPEFQALFPVTEYSFFEHKQNRIYFDFVAYVVHRIRRAGISFVDTVDIDTYVSPDYFSYRRNPDDPRRQFSTIQLTK
ncbi:MAG: polyphenol oxidase family protein [Alphaproteobacteria bacterium]